MAWKATADSLVGSACRLGGVLAGICMNLLVAVVLFEIIGRNLFNMSFGFVLDLGGWLYVALSFLALAWVMRERGHIRLTLVTDRLSPRAAVAFGVVGDLIALGFCIFFLISAWRNLARVYRTGVTAPSALDVPLYPVWIIVLIGTVLLIAQLALNVIGAGQDKGPKQGQPEEY